MKQVPCSINEFTVASGSKELDTELKDILRAKDEAVRGQDFEKLASLESVKWKLKPKLTQLLKVKKVPFKTQARLQQLQKKTSRK